MDLTDFVLNPLTLTAVIVCVVEFLKELGLKGNGLRLVAFGLGAGLALAFQLGVRYPQAAPWIEMGFFALAAGLGAPGFYRLLDDRLPVCPRPGGGSAPPPPEPLRLTPPIYPPVVPRRNDERQAQS